MTRSLHRSRRPRRLRGLAFGAALALVTTACSAVGDSAPAVEESPEAALEQAVAALDGWEGVTASFSLDFDAEARAAALADGELTDDQADLLFDSTVVVSVSDLDDPESGGVDTSIVVGDRTLFDLRVLADERFFLRLDLDEVAAIGDAADLDADVEDLLIAARMFGLGDVAQAVADGRWIELIGIDDLEDLFGDDTEPELDEAEAEALNLRLSAILQRFVGSDVDVTYVGDEDAGERLRLTTDGAALERLFAEIAAELDRAGLVEDVTGQDLDDFDLDANLQVGIDVWIADGELSQIALDLGPLSEGELPGEALVVVALEEYTGSISAPDDVEPFDILSLVGGFFGGFGGGFDDDFGGDFDDDFLDEDDLFGDFEGDFLDEDDLFGDDDAFDDDTCITAEELAELEEFLGPEAAAEFEALIDSGLVERC